MSKIVSIKLTRVSPTDGPFNIYDQWGNVIAENVSRKDLLDGVHYTVDDGVTMIKLVSVGDCTYEKILDIVNITQYDFYHTPVEEIRTGCIWIHLKNPEIYHTFYGVIEPYIIEHPLSTSPNTVILQSCRNYSKVYKYTQDLHGVSNEPSKIELDDAFFNRAIVYNDQQCSGVLNLVFKPRHNLKAYNSYPIYRNDSKDILVTKSDNEYKFNGFYDVVKNKSEFLFVRTCIPLSYDKEIHQENMIYSNRSFLKSPLRAKDSRIRLILNNRSDIHIVSQFTIVEEMISYK